MDKKVFYEIHVEGGTKLCPHVPEKDRGKFLGICSPFMIEHMKMLGVTTVQLMPVFDSEGTYWGYDPTSWFNLNPRYGTAREFNTMLDTLHENGLEVILDVVYNHVSNGSRKAFERLGVSFYDWDVTGCGNTVDVQKSLPVIMRSIQYWLEVIGVDGMRFDLANVLGREGGEFNPNAEFFTALSHYQDKILVAEPWDCMGYSLGQFPEWMLELNDQSRETLRKGTTYWCDHLDWKRSVNFITCHDGLTLYDLTSGWPEAYNMQANFKTSSYHRLLLAGDEFGNSQNGNDNAYLVGNKESWLNW